MPVYDYNCPECGGFESFAPMSAFADPCPCPDCGTGAPRAMFTAPSLSTMSSARRTAHATNERSADSPKKLSSHGPGCSCCGSGKKKKSRTLHRPDGSKSFAGSRPWMISH